MYLEDLPEKNSFWTKTKPAGVFLDVVRLNIGMASLATPTRGLISKDCGENEAN